MNRKLPFCDPVIIQYIFLRALEACTDQADRRSSTHLYRCVGILKKIRMCLCEDGIKGVSRVVLSDAAQLSIMDELGPITKANDAERVLRIYLANSNHSYIANMVMTLSLKFLIRCRLSMNTALPCASAFPG